MSQTLPLKTEAYRFVEVGTLARTIEMHLFAMHLATGVGFGFIGLAIWTAIFHQVDGLLLSLLAIPAFLFAKIRLEAKYKFLMPLSAIFIAALLTYLIFIFAITMLIEHDIENQLLIGQTSILPSIASFLALICSYYLIKALRSQYSVWTNSFKNYSKFVRKNHHAKMPVFGFLPAQGRSTETLKNFGAIVQLFLSAILFGIVTLLIIGLPVINFMEGPSRIASNIVSASKFANEFILLPAIILFASLVAIAGYQLRVRALRLIKRSADDLTLTDTRPPILYLRAFDDDQIKLQRRPFSISKFLDQTHLLQRIDELIAERFWGVGPVLAIANPFERTESVAGPALQKESVKGWQHDVLARLQESKVIVTNMNSSRGVTWELKQCLSPDYVEKCIFLIGVKRKQQRIRELEWFCENSGIILSNKNSLRRAVAVVRHQDEWLFLRSRTRRIYDYDAALLVAMERILDSKMHHLPNPKKSFEYR